MSAKETVQLVYIDDDREEAISKYLEDCYRNEKYDIRYQEVEFKEGDGYEQLLEDPAVRAANVILIDSRLFESDRACTAGKFSGEEFRIILRKVFPFIEVLVISQCGENKDLDIIPKYRPGDAVNDLAYYEQVLKQALDDCFDRVAVFRRIAQKLEQNSEIDKLLVEKTVFSLNGSDEYNDLSKRDIDELIQAFKSIQ